MIEGRTPLHLAASNGQTELTRLLVALGAKVNIQDNHNRTALHYAAGYNRKVVAEVLVASGADMNIREEEGVLYFTIY